MSHHTTPAFALRGFKDAEERERLVSEHLPQVKYIAGFMTGCLRMSRWMIWFTPASSD